MKHFHKIAAVLLAVTLLFTACAGGDTSWAMKKGDSQISSGLYILYQIVAFGEAEEKYAESAGDTYTGMKASELLKQTIDGTVAADWINARAAELCAEHLAVKEKFTEQGLTVSNESLAYIENGIGSTMANSSAFYEKNGVSEATLREYYTGYERKEELFLALYGTGGELAVGESEVKNHLAENFAKVDIMLLIKPYTVPEGETKTLEELTAEYKTDAESYLGRLKAGEAIEDLAHEWEKKQAGDDWEDDHTHAQGDFAIVLSEDARSSYGDTLVDAALTAKIGDSAMIEDEYFFAVFKKADILADSEAVETYTDAVLRELKFEEYETKLTEWAAAAQFETNAATLAKYKPSKVSFE